MRSLLIVTIAAGEIVSLAGCGEVWSHRPDCFFGLRSDDCAPGTAGYQQAQQYWIKADGTPATQMDYQLAHNACLSQIDVGAAMAGNMMATVQSGLNYRSCMAHYGLVLTNGQ